MIFDLEKYDDEIECENSDNEENNFLTVEGFDMLD
jgi:hypothetical protein